MKDTLGMFFHHGIQWVNSKHICFISEPIFSYCEWKKKEMKYD